MYRNERDYVYGDEVFPFRCFVAGLANSGDVSAATLYLEQEDGTAFTLNYPADLTLGDDGVYVLVDASISAPLAGYAGDIEYQLWVTNTAGTERCVAEGVLRVVASL